MRTSPIVVNVVRFPRKAFTLVELLVVITIIGLLATLIFPALSLLQIRAQQTKSAQNLKQIQMMIFQYQQETSVFPTESKRGVARGSASNQYIETVGSFERLHHWAKGDISSETFRCPGSSVPAINLPSNAACTGWDGQHVSYAYDWAAPGPAAAGNRIILAERDSEYWRPVQNDGASFLQAITVNGTLERAVIGATGNLNTLLDDGVTLISGQFMNPFFDSPGEVSTNLFRDRINGFSQDDVRSARRGGALINNFVVGGGSATRVFVK